jgi:hypothetical protein
MTIGMVSSMGAVLDHHQLVLPLTVPEHLFSDETGPEMVRDGQAGRRASIRARMFAIHECH